MYFSVKKKQVLRKHFNLNFVYNHRIKDLNSYRPFRKDLLHFSYQNWKK